LFQSLICSRGIRTITTASKLPLFHFPSLTQPPFRITTTQKLLLIFFRDSSNLVRAVLPHGLTEFDVHDVLNVFQVTGLDSQGRYFMESSPATKASTLTFFAETSLLCALSTCPGGDLSAWGWDQADPASGDDKPDMKSTCQPIKVEVFEIAEGLKGDVLGGWKESVISGYRGVHGMEVPVGEA